jgi:hypothetical protein
MQRTKLIMLLFAVAMSPPGVAAQSASPYVGQEQRAIKALSDEEVRDLLEARGMGLAKAAELNSYPGPLHVLQLAEQLELSDAQRGAAESLYARMRERAVALGRQIIAAEELLDRAFREDKIDLETLRYQVLAIATLRGELRVVHLETHLAQRVLLTDKQNGQYDVLRGYAIDRKPHDAHRHGG